MFNCILPLSVRIAAKVITHLSDIALCNHNFKFNYSALKISNSWFGSTIVVQLNQIRISNVFRAD